MGFRAVVLTSVTWICFFVSQGCGEDRGVERDGVDMYGEDMYGEDGWRCMLRMGWRRGNLAAAACISGKYLRTLRGN